MAKKAQPAPLKPRRIKLHGFNNLTKSLSFNIYDICYAGNSEQRNQYIEYIDAEYEADRLVKILEDVAEIIGANVLNIARQDYDPQGASVTMLISEEPLATDIDDGAARPGPLPEIVLGHLDKSHITVHTYPESHPDHGICTFRADIDVSTCGVISPLKALNYLIHSFHSDIVNLDYRVRGFTRDVRGRKHFIDHRIHSIQDFFSRDTKRDYEMIDVNVYQENLFHTKMLRRKFDLDDYLFGIDAEDLDKRTRNRIEKQLKKEMQELFYGRNM